MGYKAVRPYHKDKGNSIWCKKVIACHDRKIMFVPVPKACTKTTRYTLEGVGFEKTNYRGCEDYMAVTVLRDPLQRYVAAQIQATRGYMRQRRQEGNPCDWDEMWKMFLDGVEDNQVKIWNAHFFPAVQYLQDADGQDIPIRFYMFQEDYFGGLGALEKLVGAELRKNIYLHKTERDWKHFYLDKLAENPHVVGMIEEMYVEDRKLFNQEFEKWRSR